MGRVYSIPINISAHTAAVDIFELLAPATSGIVLLGWELAYTSETGEAQEEWLPLILKRVTGAPTSGSGGSTPTAVPILPGDAASGMTVEAGNTTQLTGGTSAEVSRHPIQVRAGGLYVAVPEGRVAAAVSTRLVLAEAGAPTDSVTGPVGWVLVEEVM